MRVLLPVFLLAAACAAPSPEGATLPAPPPARLAVTPEIPDSVAGAWDADRVLRAEASVLHLPLRPPVAGRYRVAVHTSGPAGATGWIEDYPGNPDGRTYDVTGPLGPSAEPGPRAWVRDGLPLDTTPRTLRLHLTGIDTRVDSVVFTRLVRGRERPEPLVQGTDGEGAWTVVWADEFDTDGLPDTARWTWDLGDWGWGNRERQYYTVGRAENARVEDGVLRITALRDRPSAEPGRPEWSSARLTTRGKAAFTYGRIEFRARVPAPAGCWSAGWTLGDAYRDEISWPYCGEIDILESVGFETDDATGNGLAHASAHTRAYYFKQGNHLTGVTPVAGIATDFHVYAAEWTPEAITAFVDGEPYFTYAQHDSPLAWPFDEPQHLILNLAMGGGWGGPWADTLTRAVLEVDYVRVYGRAAAENP